MRIAVLAAAILPNPTGAHMTTLLHRSMTVSALVVAGTLLHAASLQAKTFVVSNTGVNCAPTVVGPLYPTIQAAVNAVPITASATHSVVVCPGTYPEQVKVNKNVTITGVLRDGTDPVETYGNSNEAVIVPPLAGLVSDPDLPGGVAAQVTVMNIADVNLTNLSVDGTGIGCPSAGGSPVPVAGIAIYNAGTVGTGNRITVSKSVVHNQIGYCPGAGGLERSYQGTGILAHSSWFTLDSNSVSNVDLQLIHQIGGIGITKANNLNYAWHGIKLTDVSAVDGINAVGSTVSSNAMSSMSVGIYLERASHVAISSNNVTDWSGTAIALIDNSTDNTILSNRVMDTGQGINLDYGTARNVVRLNVITRATQVAIMDRFSGGGSTITNNTINQTPVGIWTYLPADDIINPNTFYNTGTLNFNGWSLP
jgi:hypothetical protein